MCNKNKILSSIYNKNKILCSIYSQNKILYSIYNKNKGLFSIDNGYISYTKCKVKPNTSPLKSIGLPCSSLISNSI